ncbi:MAG: carboxypeptidase M32 [Planctomycetes bacterium]|nr:carboxypeptidase M32 [Planctomycetota bacterium]
MSSPYAQLIDHVQRIGLLNSTVALLNWDQEVMMPRHGGAVEFRARQIAQTARLVHEWRTDPRMDEWLSACEADASLTNDPLSVSAVNLREIRRDFDRNTKLPASLVEALSQAVTLSKSAWAEARKRDDFAAFEPWLKKIVGLLREKAACLGWGEGEPWDALADGFEPGLTAVQSAALFAPLRGELVELVGELLDDGTPPSDAFNTLELPIDKQRAFVRHVAEQVGFDFSRGRVDESSHPFCLPLHRDDVRMTTRFQKYMLNDSLGSTLHESGHGIYNQHVPGGEHTGTPMGNAVRLSIHESQSRLIENQVGRSAAFWRWCYPKLREFFGAATDGLTFDDVYGGANIVARSLIRTESDEATYNLHIMVRFDLERALVRGDLSAADVPAAWNEKYRQYLGIDVPDNRRGCLQDMHWAQGAIGYFPTYTLGNLYAAQFYEQARRDIGDLDGRFAAGDFAPLVDWLAANIHQHAMRYRADELCMHVTGEALSAEPLLRHLRQKLRPIYGLK